MLDSFDAPAIDTGYSTLKPDLQLGLPFKPVAVGYAWSEWPSLPELLPVAFSGVKTARDGFLVDIDLDRLSARIDDYFNAGLLHEEIASRHLIAMQTAPQFDPQFVRDTFLERGGPV